MAKYRVKMKLTGFELEIEGTREDVPVIAQNIGHQLSGLLGPATNIIEGELMTPSPITVTPAPAEPPASSTSRRKTRRTPPKPTASTAGGTATAEGAVSWRHDTAKHGSPKQEWSGSNKALWLLYVAAAEAAVTEMSGTRIATTFNTHFRSAGQIRAHNINRDLAKLKVARGGEPPLVSEDTTKMPSAWFLTDAGTKAAQKLIAEALGQSA